MIVILETFSLCLGSESHHVTAQNAHLGEPHEADKKFLGDEVVQGVIHKSLHQGAKFSHIYRSLKNVCNSE